MDFWNWGAAEWGAFGQVGALVVAAVAGVLVWLQVRQGRQVREDQIRPYVILDFEFQGAEVMIAIRNIGTTPARKVQFEFDKPFRGTYADDPGQYAVFSDGIPMLAPGRVISIPFGHGPDFFSDKSDAPLQYTASVSYENLEGSRRYEDPALVIDLLPFKHTYIQHDDLHQISRNLKEIKDLMKSWTSARRLQVNTVTPAEVDERNRELRELRDAQRAAEEGATTDGAAVPPNGVERTS